MERKFKLLNQFFILVIAGTIEGFLSPSNLPAWVKYGTGISTGIAMYSYLLLVGREEAEIKKTAA